MAKTYDEHVVDEVAAAKKRTDEFSTQRKAQADEAVKTSDSLYDTAIATAEKNYNASAEETENSYRSVYDANAVDELVARRNVEEAMANMGLTDSGLNRTQQTAISLQRGRADSKTSLQKQAAVDAIMRELDNARAQYNAEKTAASADIYAQADADILNFKTSADTAARENAVGLYTADQEAEAARIAAEQEAIAAQYAAEQEAATKQAQLLLDMQRTAAMRYTGTPSYTAINAQAMIYGRTDKAKANEYIERQYNAGYITSEQKNDLLDTYGNGSNVTVVTNSILTPEQARYSGELNIYRTYESYVLAMVQDAISKGTITADEGADVIFRIEKDHNVEINPKKWGYV